MSSRHGIAALGLHCPLGRGKREVARGLFAGSRSGMVRRDDLIPGRSVIVGAVAEDLPGVPVALAHYGSRNNRMMLSALREIEADILAAKSRYGAHRIGVVLGTSTSGVADTEAALAARRARARLPDAYDWRMMEMGDLSGFVADLLELRGPAYVVSTACSSSAKVMASAARLIDLGLCDAVLAGGADSLAQLTVGGFGALEALSKGHCNPMSALRDGINIGEGAAVMLVTAEDAPIVMLGVGESSDAHHISAPDPEGKGASDAMTMALKRADLAPSDIAYVNLHGTATLLNDAMEASAVARLLGPDTPCSSTKPMTGHMLGAAGAVEVAFLWLSLSRDFSDGRLPPHLWDGAVDDALPMLRLVSPGFRLSASTRMAMMSNSFAFGGSNCSVVLGLGH